MVSHSRLLGLRLSNLLPVTQLSRQTLEFKVMISAPAPDSNLSDLPRRQASVTASIVSCLIIFTPLKGKSRENKVL
jgi:hypothetical protein